MGADGHLFYDGTSLCWDCESIWGGHDECGVPGTKKIWLDGQYGFNRYVQCNFRQPFTAVHILHHGYYGGGAFL